MATAAVGPINGLVLTNDRPHYTDTRKDCGGAVYDFLTTQMKNVAKAVAYTFGWVSLGFGKEHQVGQIAGEVSSFAGNTKNFLSTIEIPAKVMEAQKTLKQLIENPTPTKARELFLDKIPAVFNPLCDAASLTNEFVPLGSDLMKVVKGVNFGATFIGAANGAVNDIQKIGALSVSSEKNTEKTSLYLINLARDVSYTVLGALGMIAVIFSVAVAPWMFLACLTSGLFFTITGFFYDRVVDPNDKHIDPARFRTNFNYVVDQRNEAVAQRDRLQAQAANA